MSQIDRDSEKTVIIGFFNNLEVNLTEISWRIVLSSARLFRNLLHLCTVTITMLQSIDVATQRWSRWQEEELFNLVFSRFVREKESCFFRWSCWRCSVSPSIAKTKRSVSYLKSYLWIRKLMLTIWFIDCPGHQITTWVLVCASSRDNWPIYS